MKKIFIITLYTKSLYSINVINRRKIRILYHILFWIGIAFLLPIWYNSSYSKYYIKNLIAILIGLPGFIIGLYFIVYYLVPKLLLKKKRYIQFIVIYFALMILFTLHDILISRYIFLPLVEPEYIMKYETYMFRPNHMFRVFVMMQSQIFIFIALKYLKNYVENYFEKEQLKSKMVETELSMLKGQIHPHFLFNTLNNIYTLSLEGDNRSVSESIEKLSEFLRYTIYECKNKFISLKKEINIIENYINLEKLRYSNLDINISIPENINFIYVVPLLYFTFIENAFKHGTSKSTKHKWIDVKLEISNGNIIFTVKNSKSKKTQTDTLNYSNGIGLLNARKRLDLYLGKDNHKLEIKDQNDLYEIRLCHKIIDNNDKMLNNR